FARNLAALGEGELRLLPDALVGVTEQLRQLLGGTLLEALGEQLLDLGDGGVLDALGVGDLVDAALARPTPAIDPVAEIETAVVAELHIGRKRAPDELTAVHELEAGTVRLVLEGADAAVAGAAPEVGQEEMALVLVAEADAGIVRQAGRPVAEV